MIYNNYEEKAWGSYNRYKHTMTTHCWLLGYFASCVSFFIYLIMGLVCKLNWSSLTSLSGVGYRMFLIGGEIYSFKESSRFMISSTLSPNSSTLSLVSNNSTHSSVSIAATVSHNYSSAASIRLFWNSLFYTLSPNNLVASICISSYFIFSAYRAASNFAWFTLFSLFSSSTYSSHIYL